MNDGLKVIQVPGRYGYSATLVGWLRRVGGDEWELLPGARVVGRVGAGIGLGGIAAKGPTSDYRLFDPSETVEHIHRLVIRRALACNEKVWAKHCPKPKGWAS
jgi:hypothetical protein